MTRHHSAIRTLAVFSVLAGLLIEDGGFAQQCELRWQELTLPNPPIGRQWHGMAFDSARGRTVLFGGADVITLSGTNDVYGDTWEFDGSSWEQRFPAHAPAGRFGHSMTYDAARGVTVLFGGQREDGLNNDLWEWNGSDWTQVPVSDPWPIARRAPGMAYDSMRRVHVMFGGLGVVDGVPGSQGDTWEYDGAARRWTLRSQIGPSPRSRIQLAFDAARNNTVLFGGQQSTTELNDTWLWNGSGGTWTQMSPPTSPPTRYLYSLAYDSHRMATLMQCGQGRFGSFPVAYVRETWEWDGTNWRNRTSDYGFCCPRSGAGMVYDARLGQMVLFGGNGSSDTATWVLRKPSVFVDWRNLGAQDGSEARPFRTVRQAVDAACAIIQIQIGDYAEGFLTINKPLRLEALNGAVSIH